MSVREKVLHAFQKSGVMSGGETLIVGFSGGADSVTLLHTLLSLREELALSAIVAVHIDHRLRGEESDRDRLFAEAFCQKHGIACYTYTYDVFSLAEESGKGLEEMGRELRYQAFYETAARFEKAYIVTAHTMSDNVETLLLHLSRGCAVKGLTGIPLVRDTVIRPLLLCDREEIEAYCYENNLDFVTDSTNTDITYARNRVRHRILPELKQINPAFERACFRLMTHMTEVEDFLDQQGNQLFMCVKTDEPDTYKRAPLLKAHPLLQTVFLEKLLSRFNISPSEVHLTNMRDCLVNGVAVSLPKEYRFVTSEDYVYLLPAQPVSVSAVALQDGETISFFSKSYRLLIVSRKEYEQKLNISKFLFKNACDYDMISGVVALRSRCEGDAFRPCGRGCSKTLKKLFNEAAVFSEKRGQIPILCDEKGIILVYGFGCDERVRITDKTEKVLILEKIGE